MLNMFPGKSPNARAFVFAVFITNSIRHVCSTFIDKNNPIVIHDNSGGNENYFGYSLAYLQGSLGNTSRGNGGSLFIGAPRETRFTSNFGVIWECKFKHSQLSCSIMRQISEQNSPEESQCTRYANKTATFPESVTDQWIGESVIASSDKLFACGPRWKSNGWGRRLYNGFLQNCSLETSLVGICFQASDQNSLQPIDPIQSRSDFGRQNPDAWYRFVQFGFSVHVTRSDTLIIGAPVPFRPLSGLVVEYQKKQTTNPSVMHNENGQISDDNSYYGYSVTSATTRSGEYYIASGAPRGNNLYGSVILNVTRSKSWEVHRYNGKQLGSYFGYALASVDLNGDGYDELLVGAPMHTSEFSSGGTHTTGCVMIFDPSLLPNTTQLPTNLCPNSGLSSFLKVSSRGRFGNAICNLGDINADNREDFAVSAPYDDMGVGTVFNFYGRYPPSNRPDEIIRGKSLSIRGLRGFGTYLLGDNTVDIDGNGTPDLGIGAFWSRHVIVLRTRPMATASLTISFHTSGSSEGNGKIAKLSPSDTSVRVRICVQLTFSVTLRSPVHLDSWIYIQVNITERRINFENGENRIESPLRVSSSQISCLDTTAHLVANDKEDENDNSIVFLANFKFNETNTINNKTVQQASLTITRDTTTIQTPGYSTSYSQFDPHRPAPIHSTNPISGSLEVAGDNCDSDGKPECDPDLLLNTRVFLGLIDSNETQEWQESKKRLIIGQLDSVIISAVVSNLNETANLPIFRITMSVSRQLEMTPSLLRFEWRDSPGVLGRCSTELPEVSNGKQSSLIGIARCARRWQTGTKAKFTFAVNNLQHLKIKGKENLGDMKWTVEAFPEADEATEKVEASIRLPLEGNVVIDLESTVPPKQSNIDPRETSVVSLTQLFVVKNSGYSATAQNQVTAEVLVPTHLNVKGGVMQVFGVANPSTGNIRCDPVDFQFSEVASLDMDRNRRTLLAEKASKLESTDKIVTLSGCGEKNDGKGECRKIRCQMDLPSKGSKEIRIQVYLMRNAIGKLISEETKGIRVNTVVTARYFGKVITKTANAEIGFIWIKSIPAWIYLASGAGGTVLLILITFVLFKCGFFRRKTKEELTKLKRQTMQPLDFNTLSELYQDIPEAEDEHN